MNRTPLIHLGLAFLALILCAGALGFWYAQIGAAQTQAASLANDIAQRSGDSERTAGVRTALAALSADEESLGAHFVATGDIVSFLEELQATGRRFGAKIEVGSVSDNAQSPRGELSLSLSIQGSFPAVMRTLGALEYGPYAMKVKDLTLDTPEGGTAAEWTATASFTAKTITRTP